MDPQPEVSDIETIHVLLEYDSGSGWRCQLQEKTLFGDLAEELCDTIYESLKEQHGEGIAVFYDYTDDSLRQASQEDWNDPDTRGIIEQSFIDTPGEEQLHDHH
jgi:hypothetical protein